MYGILPYMPISASSRIDARLRPEQKSRIERAASLKGTSVSEFMIQNADEAAIRTIQEYESWALTARDRDAFVKALLHPPSPNAALRKAAQRYRQRASK
jgi:uncharacterized protein (DUF1778 family)